MKKLITLSAFTFLFAGSEVLMANEIDREHTSVFKISPDLVKDGYTFGETYHNYVSGERQDTCNEISRNKSNTEIEFSCSTDFSDPASTKYSAKILKDNQYTDTDLTLTMVRTKYNSHIAHQLRINSSYTNSHQDKRTGSFDYIDSAVYDYYNDEGKTFKEDKTEYLDSKISRPSSEITLLKAEDHPPAIMVFAGSKETKEYKHGYTEVLEGSNDLPERLWPSTIPVVSDKNKPQSDSFKPSAHIKNYNFNKTEIRNKFLGNIYIIDPLNDFNLYTYEVCFDGVNAPDGEECVVLNVQAHLGVDRYIKVSLDSAFGDKYKLAYSKTDISNSRWIPERAEDIEYSDEAFCPTRDARSCAITIANTK